MVQLKRHRGKRRRIWTAFYVRNKRGDLIQLSAIVSRETGAAPNTIEHYNRLRSSTISASLATCPRRLSMGSAIDRAKAMLGHGFACRFPLRWDGEAAILREPARKSGGCCGLAAGIVYMTLAAQFESLIHPLTVMLALPLAAVGAFGTFGLLDMGGKLGFIQEFPAMNINLFSQIGLMLLVGLVTKNSILLVEFANHEGCGIACRAQKR